MDKIEKNEGNDLLLRAPRRHRCTIYMHMKGNVCIHTYIQEQNVSRYYVYSGFTPGDFLRLTFKDYAELRLAALADPEKEPIL